MRVAIYIRVSTDEQADKGNSLTEQKERLAAYCTAMGWINPVYYEDDGYSAKDLRRPAIQRLLKDVQKNKIDIVLTSKLDRFCRNLLDLLQTVELLNNHNCSYVSSSESFDTSTAVGRMTLQLLGTFAEFERERNSERVKDNMLSLAKNTNRAITGPCFGYDVLDGQYVVNNEEAKFVRLMFDLAEEGHGHRMIAKMLNDRGSVTKRGKMWDQTNVKRLMATETITGTMVYNKRESKNGKTLVRDKSEWVIKDNNHPAIIEPDRFENVREILKSRSRTRRAESETYLLTGLLLCKHCGRNMKGSTARHKTKYNNYIYHRYICASYVLGYGCKHHAVHRDPLEDAIMNEIKRIANTSAATLEISVVVPSVEDELKNLKEQLSRIDRRMQKQIDAFSNDLITEYDLKAASEKVAIERDEIQTQIKRLQENNSGVEAVQDKAKTILEVLNGKDRLKAKAALHGLIHKIELENGEAIGIIWRA